MTTHDAIEQAGRVINDEVLARTSRSIGQISSEHVARTLANAGLLADPLPSRDEIARALFLEQYPNSAGAWDTPDEFGKDGWRRKADAVLTLLEGRKR